MRTTARRLAVITAAAVVAAGIAVPLTASPVAAAGVDRVWRMVDTDGDGGAGLHYSDGAAGALVRVEEGTRSHVRALSQSADGSRIIYIRDRWTSDWKPWRQEVVVRDTSSRLVDVLDVAPLGGYRRLSAPSLSPDGRRAVWEEVSDYHGYMVRHSRVGAGNPGTWKIGYSPYAFLAQNVVLVQNAQGYPYTGWLDSGALYPVPGLPTLAMSATVSPDLTKIAYGLWDPSSPDDGPWRASMQVAPLTYAEGKASVGPATPLDSWLYNFQPTFSRDGSTLYWVKNAGKVGAKGDLWSAPTDGSAASAVVNATATSDRDVAVTSTPSTDATAPGAVSVDTFVLNGTAATIRWALPSDADLSGVIVSRSGRTVYLPAPLTSYVDSGLTLGQTYTYQLKAVDRFGNLSAGVTRKLTAIKPAPYVGTPTSQRSTTLPFPVRFALGAQPDTKVWATYRPSGGTTQPWVEGVPGAIRTFGAPATTGVAATTAVAGGTYAFAVKVEDAFGNSSGWAYGPRAIVPFDQSKATIVGGTTHTSGEAYLGSFRQLRTTSSYARLAVRGHRLMVVGWRCKSCGQFAVYQGSTRIAIVDTYASSLQPRVVLFSTLADPSHLRTFTIRPLATAGRPAVNLDGFAVET